MPVIRATYRLQLEPAFTFDAAAAIVPYLAALGISHVYCSPVFEAVPGSRHGYDVVDPTRVRGEIGGEAGWRRLLATLAGHDMGIVVDLVPNHMALEGNPWWEDVLREGPASAYAGFFDVVEDLSPGARLILPVLANPYGDELLAGRLRLVVEPDGLAIAYDRHRFPVSRASERRVVADASAEDPQLRDAAVAQVNADVWRLHALLEEQHYRLAWWRLARDESPYRRFFDVNQLIGVRVEEEAVFTATHRLVAEWMASGAVDGLRVDHVDGLADPTAYLERLRGLAPGARLFVEKILAPEEDLPDWPVDGTTGYEFGAAMTRLLLPAEAEPAVTALYTDVTGGPATYDEVAVAARREVAAHWLAGDVRRVADLLHARCQEDVRLRDYSVRDCSALVRECVAWLPVYRTYVRPGAAALRDVAVLDGVLERVREARPDLPAPLVEAAAFALHSGGAHPLEREFVRRFQQLCTAVAAKAEEDTAFYRYPRLLALNDVGARPQLFAEPAAAFHARVMHWQQRAPWSLRATSTHDSKRGEDVRARLAVLPEVWDAWAAAVACWCRRGEALRRDGQPDAAFEYAFYQTLVGAWPLSRERAHVHVEKAVREAKEHTSWEVQAADYEAAVRRFVDGVYDDAGWLADIDAFVRSLFPADAHKMLTQLLLKLTVPGVPDIYQGAELWHLALVDPDNRGAVDFSRRASLLAALEAQPPADVLAGLADGVPKLHVIRRTLAAGRRTGDLAPEAAYQPLPLAGPAAERAIAYLRGERLAVVAPIRTWRPDWAGTTAPLPDGRWQHVFTGETFAGGAVNLADLFVRYPVALLERAA